MAQEFAKTFYRSCAWRRTRAAYIAYRKAIDGGLCESCKSNLGKIVHHKMWLNESNILNPDVALNFKNLRLECQTCHNAEKEKVDCGCCRYGLDGEILPPFAND